MMRGEVSGSSSQRRNRDSNSRASFPSPVVRSIGSFLARALPPPSRTRLGRGLRFRFRPQNATHGLLDFL